MDLLKLVQKHLEENGYDGLYSYVGECSCSLDDLMPCQEQTNLDECEPGHKIPCSEDCRERFGGEGCAFHIGRKE